MPTKQMTGATAVVAFGRPPRTQFQRGMELALALYREMNAEIFPDVPDGHPDCGLRVGDTCQLDPEYRGRYPFRPLLLERLNTARSLGPDVEAGFCAFLSHVVALAAMGIGTTPEDTKSFIEGASS